MDVLVPIFVADELLLLVPRQISYDVAPTTADHVTVTLAVDVPSVALTFAGADTLPWRGRTDHPTMLLQLSVAWRPEMTPRYHTRSLPEFGTDDQ